MMLLLLVSWMPLPARGQEHFSLEATMECFRETTGQPSNACTNDAVSVSAIVFGWRDWDQNIVDQVAGALAEAAGSRDLAYSSRAIAMLGVLGAKNNGRPGWPGTVQYLNAAYLASEQPEYVLWVVPMQTDTAALVDFLTQAVRGSIRPDAIDERRRAAFLLSTLGPRGESALRSVEREGIGEPAVARKVKRLVEKP